MTPSRPPAALAAATAVAALLAGCTGGTTVDRADGGYASEYGITLVPVDEREAAPPVAGETLDGEQLSLDDFVGETVLLNVWGQWCGPCVDEADDLVQAERELGEVAFVGLNIRDEDDAARAFEREYGIDWPSIYDQASTNLLGFTDLPAAATPTTYVIDAEGRVAARLLGPQTAQTFVDVVEEVRGDG